MARIRTVAAIICLTFAASTAYAVPKLKSPEIVASVAFENQTNQVPPTTLLPTTESGTFRLCAVIETADTDISHQTDGLFQWADDFGFKGLQILSNPTSDPTSASICTPLRLAAGYGLGVLTFSQHGVTLATPYSLYVTVERLQ